MAVSKHKQIRILSPMTLSADNSTQTNAHGTLNIVKASNNKPMKPGYIVTARIVRA